VKDFGAAATHLRRMLAVLSQALPHNYPGATLYLYTDLNTMHTCVHASSSPLRPLIAPTNNPFTHTHTYTTELGDFYHGLGVSLYNHLQPRLAAGGALPRKTLSELKTSFEKALAVRRAALGEGHPLTKESREMVEAIGAGG
jgi:hypothetical protein